MTLFLIYGIINYKIKKGRDFMSKRWIISDTHFGHANIIKYCDRPYANTEEMEKALIKNWNSVVKADDIVYCLGDFALCGVDKKKELVEKLNGRKHLIMGNHDSGSPARYREFGFEEVSKHPIIIDGFFILSHEPVFLNEHMPYVNIHGHLHDKCYEGNQHINVSVERINYTPADFDVIKNKFISEGN